jgi:hypothetical protein
MAKRSFRQRFVRAAMALAVGGSALQLSGCDPAVRSTLLTGLESTTQGLSSALITAFFLSLADDDTIAASTGMTTTP